uniref:Retrovirus-related Pol polyprotein from transposon TNT 1-94 n=1 Tax=Cajanus cajan TaxID=3821 RepID=A0A151TCJ4_CAJCA|nr:hypothetical protein KK1_019378 [Cajanus cajan]
MTPNLISLSMLDSLGCSYRVEGGVLRVSKGAMVVMKRKLKMDYISYKVA